MSDQLETIIHHPDALLLELTFSPQGNLIVRIPDSMSQKGGKVTLERGNVENQLRNILDIENKIRHAEARFYGEPDVRSLANDLKAGRIQSTKIRNSTAPLELELDI